MLNCEWSRAVQGTYTLISASTNMQALVGLAS